MPLKRRNNFYLSLIRANCSGSWVSSHSSGCLMPISSLQANRITNQHRSYSRVINAFLWNESVPELGKIYFFLYGVDPSKYIGYFWIVNICQLLPLMQLQQIDCSVYESATPYQTAHPTPPKSKWTSLVRLTIIEGVEALAYGDHTLQPWPLVSPRASFWPNNSVNGVHWSGFLSDILISKTILRIFGVGSTVTNLNQSKTYNVPFFLCDKQNKLR